MTDALPEWQRKIVETLVENPDAQFSILMPRQSSPNRHCHTPGVEQTSPTRQRKAGAG